MQQTQDSPADQNTGNRGVRYDATALPAFDQLDEIHAASYEPAPDDIYLSHLSPPKNKGTDVEFLDDSGLGDDSVLSFVEELRDSAERGMF